ASATSVSGATPSPVTLDPESASATSVSGATSIPVSLDPESASVTSVSAASEPASPVALRQEPHPPPSPETKIDAPQSAHHEHDLPPLVVGCSRSGIDNAPSLDLWAAPSNLPSSLVHDPINGCLDPDLVAAIFTADLPYSGFVHADPSIPPARSRAALSRSHESFRGGFDPNQLAVPSFLADELSGNTFSYEDNLCANALPAPAAQPCPWDDLDLFSRIDPSVTEAIHPTEPVQRLASDATTPQDRDTLHPGLFNPSCAAGSSTSGTSILPYAQSSQPAAEETLPDATGFGAIETPRHAPNFPTHQGVGHECGPVVSQDEINLPEAIDAVDAGVQELYNELLAMLATDATPVEFDGEVIYRCYVANA
ncbi:hypothetical protein AURDEDRAFT_177524, partial [Auricularia subglabra TFB-10046 SS5]